MLEDSNLLRSYIYDEVINILKLDNEDSEVEYIKTHIFISNIEEIERLYLYTASIVPHLQNQRDKKLYKNYPLIDEAIYNKQTTIKTKELLKYYEKIKNTISTYIQDLVENGYINK